MSRRDKREKGTNVDQGEGYPSSIVLGEEYRDTQTGITGRATVISFFEHACERVVLEYVKDGEIKEVGFDVPRVESVKEPEREMVSSGKPGGPHDAAPTPSDARR